MMMLMLLGACKEELAQNPEPALPPELVAQEQARQDCTQAGGKSCSSSYECEGFCLAEGQVCTLHSPHFGCFETYGNGQSPTVCVD